MMGEQPLRCFCLLTKGFLAASFGTQGLVWFGDVCEICSTPVVEGNLLVLCRNPHNTPGALCPRQPSAAAAVYVS